LFLSATILGILVKLNNKPAQKTVYVATITAFAVSLALLVGASLLGYKIHILYTGKVEDFIEGVLMILSALFITWAVFFLHSYFGSYKVRLLQKVSHSLSDNEQKGLFFLTFTAVFREGFEIVLFLSTIYFSENPISVLSGSFGGLVLGLLISAAFFTATLRLPIYLTFKITSILLVIFAAGLLGRGIHEFAELRLLPEFGEVTFKFLPHSASFFGQMLKSVFGISQEMQGSQIGSYALYTAIMAWILYLRHKMNRIYSLVRSM
jgi:high-affinity iron transporter